MALLAEHTKDPRSVPVAIETDKNLIVVALQTAGLRIYPILSLIHISEPTRPY